MSNSKQKKKVESEALGSMNAFDYQFNTVSLPKDLQDEMRSKGLEWRFINFHHLKQNGYHKTFWQPYKPDKKPEFVFGGEFGQDPNGYVIRKDLILAVKPAEEAKKMRNMLKNKTQMLTRSATSAQHAKNMKEQYGSDLGESADFKDISDEE